MTNMPETPTCLWGIISDIFAITLAHQRYKWYQRFLVINQEMGVHILPVAVVLIRLYRRYIYHRHFHF